MANFSRKFQEGFLGGLPLGVSSYQRDQKRRQDADKEEAERIAKIQQERERTESLSALMGVMTVKDSTGNIIFLPPKQRLGKPQRIVGDDGKIRIQPSLEDVPFQRKAPIEEASLFGKLFPEDIKIYKQFIKRQKEDEPNFVGTPKHVWNPKTFTYDVKQFDRKSKKYITFGQNKNFKRRISSDVIDGEFMVGDVKAGTKGMRSRLIVYEATDREGNHLFEIIDLGRSKRSGRSKSGGSDPPLDEVSYNLKLGDLLKDNAKTMKRHTAFTSATKGFTNQEESDAHKDGINAELYEQAWEYANLGSKEAKTKIMELFNEGKGLIGKDQIGSGTKVTRKMFYEQEVNKIKQQRIAGEWEGRDAGAILQFLDKLYNLWLPHSVFQREKDDIMFLLPELVLD